MLIDGEEYEEQPSDNNCNGCAFHTDIGCDQPNLDCFGIIFVLKKEQSDGSTANYYTLPEAATQLQDLISFKNMNSQIGEIFRACYRYGQVAHSPKLRDAKKILFYIQAEIERLEKYDS